LSEVNCTKTAVIEKRTGKTDGGSWARNRGGRRESRVQLCYFIAMHCFMYNLMEEIYYETISFLHCYETSQTTLLISHKT
jgi:hypothetical protein